MLSGTEKASSIVAFFVLVQHPNDSRARGLVRRNNRGPKPRLQFLSPIA